MTARERPPYRADHVGSLLRPPEVLAARAERAAGRISAEDLEAVEDLAVRAAVQVQEDIGLRSATDGEYRRGSWHMDFIYQLGGVTTADERLTTVSAEAMLRDRGRLGAKRRAVVDQAAAVVILQHALDTERASGTAPGEIIEEST